MRFNSGARVVSSAQVGRERQVLKHKSEGERREKGKEVGSTFIPFPHAPLIGYFTLLNSIGLILNFCLFCLIIIFLLFIIFWLSGYTAPTRTRIVGLSIINIRD